jgi:hypothetical protein
MTEHPACAEKVASAKKVAQGRFGVKGKNETRRFVARPLS